MQWDTIRKVRATFSNQIRAAAVSNSTTLTLSDNKGSGYERLTIDPCGSLWFSRFTTGCKNRMGQDCRPKNHAIGSSLMVQLRRLTETRIKDAELFEDRKRWVMAGCYLCFCLVVSLRSPEGLMTDLEGLTHYHNASDDFVIIPLRGKVKGENHTRQHLLHSVNVTDSGIDVRSWIQRLMTVHNFRGRMLGPAFVDPLTQSQSTTSDMSELFIELLVELFDSHRILFGVEIGSFVEVKDKYHVFRSFRRGSESQAVAKRIAEAARYVVNRWKKKEAAGTKKANLLIDQHYVHVSLVKDAFLRYTQAM